jgi:alpha-galactosidase
VRVKPLEGGAVAVGLFNTGGYGETAASHFRWGDEPPVAFDFRFAEAGLPAGKWHVRDAWRQEDLGVHEDGITTTIPHHGVVVLVLKPAHTAPRP